jgi:hypothetical protein
MGGFMNVSSVYVICSAAASYIFHLFFFICNIVRMEGGGYWSNMVTGDDVDVAGLENFTFPMIHDMPSQAEQVDVQVQPHGKVLDALPVQRVRLRGPKILIRRRIWWYAQLD